jgi:hypothetical protein
VGKTTRLTLVVALAFVLAVCGTFFFGYRAGRAARRMHLAQEPVRAWMSIPFVAHAHHVPPEAIYRALGVKPLEPRDHRPIRRLARELNRPVPEVIAQVEQAVRQAGGQAPEHPSR